MYSNGEAAHRGGITQRGNETVSIRNVFESVVPCRSVYSAAAWYYHHLAGLINVVMITEDQEAVARYCNLTAGVYVIGVQARQPSAPPLPPVRAPPPPTTTPPG